MFQYPKNQIIRYQEKKKKKPTKSFLIKKNDMYFPLSFSLLEKSPIIQILIKITNANLSNCFPPAYTNNGKNTKPTHDFQLSFHGVNTFIYMPPKYYFRSISLVGYTLFLVIIIIPANIKKNNKY